MDSSKIDEEKLREAACYGDVEAVQALIKRGVNVNAQHSINGWTALHWAAKRNNFEELAADLTTNPAILNLFGSLPTNLEKPKETAALPIVPNYIANPEFNHKIEVNDTSTRTRILPTVSAPTVQGNELVIKLRLAYSSDTDFVEVELNKTADLTYTRFMEICCSELGISQKYVERLRKLPDTRLRKDADVQRLRNFQEIEVVLVGSKPKPILNADTNAGTVLQNSQPILY